MIPSLASDRRDVNCVHYLDTDIL